MSKGLRALDAVVDKLLSYTPTRKAGTTKKRAAEEKSKTRARVTEREGRCDEEAEKKHAP